MLWIHFHGKFTHKSISFAFHRIMFHFNYTFWNPVACQSCNISEFIWNHAKICKLSRENHTKLLFTDFKLHANGEMWNQDYAQIHVDFDHNPSLVLFKVNKWMFDTIVN